MIGTPLLLDARQAAKALAISERTLWTMTQRGEIPCVRVGSTGRGVRYDPRDLAAWVDRAKTRGNVPESAKESA